MKKLNLILAILLITAGAFAQSVGINSDGTAPNASAMLDVSSTSKGLLAPRMTAEQRGLISSPATGLLVYQTDGETGYYHYNGSAWVTSSSLWSSNLEGAIYYNTGNVGIGMTTPGHKLTVEGTGTANTGVLGIDVTGDASFTWASSAVAPNLTAGHNLIHMIGKAESEYNSGYMGFHFNESGNSDNFLTFGLHSHDNLLNITGAGNVGIGTTSPSYKLDISSVDNYGIRIGPNSSSRSLLLGGWNDTDFTEARITTSNGNLHLDAKAGLGVSGIYLNHYHSGDVYLVGGGGNVGIGTTAPDAKLHINAGAGKAAIKIDGTSYLEFGAGISGKEGNAGKIAYQLYTSDALDIIGAAQEGSTRKIKFWAEGGSYFNGRIDVVGGAYCTGTTWVDVSDARLKRDIQSMTKYGLKEVLELQPVTYYFVSDTTNHPEVGFIAQDVQKIIPEVVRGKEGDIEKGETLGLSYGNLVPVLTKAIQEQQAQLEAQQTQIEVLKAQNTMLSEKVNELDNLKAEVESLKKAMVTGGSQLTDNN